MSGPPSPAAQTNGLFSMDHPGGEDVPVTAPALDQSNYRCENRTAVVGPTKPRLFSVFGPGLISGASDDDPSGIATYSQAGAQFGFAITWTLLFTFPLMATIQEISGHIGRTTGAASPRILLGTIRTGYCKRSLRCCWPRMLSTSAPTSAQWVTRFNF